MVFAPPRYKRSTCSLLESPHHSVRNEQTDRAASLMLVSGVLSANSTRSDSDRGNTILPASTTSHRFNDAQELNTWLLVIPEEERPVLYYNMCNGWLYTCREVVGGSDLTPSFHHVLSSLYYVWHVNEDDAAFVLPSDAMTGNGRGLYFCGSKGSSEIDSRYMEQVVLLIVRYYPTIDLADCLSMLPIDNEFVSTP